MEQTERLLSLLVHWHFVLEFTPLLSEGAGSIVYPFVTVDLFTAAGAIGGGGGAGENIRGGSDDVVDAILLLAYGMSVSRQYSRKTEKERLILTRKVGNDRYKRLMPLLSYSYLDEIGRAALDSTSRTHRRLLR